MAAHDSTRPAFTPGPWYVQPSDAKNRIGEYTVRGADLPNKQSPGDWFICNTFTGMEAEEANAHLIAAAPDLYAALKELRGILNVENALRPDYGWREEVQKIDDLLAKADGHETR